VGLVLIPGLPTVGGTELIIFLVIILLLFGAKRIPELARGLGSGVREFRQGVKSSGEEDDKKREELPPGEEPEASAEEPLAEEPRTEEPRSEEPRTEEPRVEERSEQKS
jgi:sec-independent protein translocase protein TatA